MTTQEKQTELKPGWLERDIERASARVSQMEEMPDGKRIEFLLSEIARLRAPTDAMVEAATISFVKEIPMPPECGSTNKIHAAMANALTAALTSTGADI